MSSTSFQWSLHHIDLLTHHKHLKILNMIHTYDEHLYAHSVESARLVELLSKKLGISHIERKAAVTAAYCHDVGKSYWPAELKTKPTLDKNDWLIIRKHPSTGVAIVKEIWPDVPQLVLRIIMEHHERPDGNGYPVGLESKQIHPLSQLVSACEAYNAMTSFRPYRDKTIRKDDALLILSNAFGGLITDALKIITEVEYIKAAEYDNKAVAPEWSCVKL